MDEPSRAQLRGLARLVHDGVSQVAGRVEHYHRHTAERVFGVLEAIEPIAPPTRIVHRVFDLSLTGAYGAVQAVNQGLAQANDWVLSHLPGDRRSQP